MNVLRMQKPPLTLKIHAVAATVLQPYCNRADTGSYALDKATPPDH
jgi:hypothetical protein